MSFFKDSDELKKILGGFFNVLATDPAIGPKLLNSKLILKFIYREPDASITVDLSGASVVITFDDQIKKPIVEMNMKGDTAHRFWKGEVNLVIALARREITARGPIPQILKLLPLIKSAYGLYPQYLKAQSIPQ
ncbi:MAG: hypothetical protein A3G32_07985 [Deltaproteobacteria bacterium RIFCSPLOWO2_12_FULL_40_28]|nr:MAG: hypothetical protein A3C45_00685 [Deltaproteobacteria bacterium RIFCSPHIGHO2_02_FULL_40_28]OGQ20851.1 MAG: hypothetical protein A3E27_03350 [Deltaproteobacteria bacterium RIFCSPHIGHO2_12_FULL_40_32]OGQ39252.1 MAG: hypothetical protein A3I69_04710 [Deltaproteobacteria bacterium RIFCSPLOWO2_02_FULL_40_36]OGQ54533.1 MAG: hypothetical protein A3G32_07985 [Deltaproteobacteria bacterium RIFCSPLOWO2_12_FULL_40_28]